MGYKNKGLVKKRLPKNFLCFVIICILFFSTSVVIKIPVNVKADDPVVIEWKDDFNLKPILRGERATYGHQDNLFLTNIQQIYERQSDSIPINPLQTLLGPKPKAEIDLNQQSMLDIVKNLDSLMIMNDEAHHVHDEELAWYKAILSIHAEIKQNSSKFISFNKPYARDRSLNF